MSTFQEVISTQPPLYNILLQLEYDDVIDYCEKNKDAQRLCQDTRFWKDKALKDFGITSEVFDRFTPIVDSHSLAAQKRYLQLLTKHGGIMKGSERYLFPTEFVTRAIRAGKDDLVQYALANLPGNHTLDMIREYARRGDQVTVDYLLDLDPKHEPNHHDAAEGALKGGHLELFNHIRSRTPKVKSWINPYFLPATAESGNIKLFDTIKMLDTHKYTDAELIEMSSIALQHGHIDLFNHIRSLIVSNKYDWNIPAIESLNSKRPEQFKYIMKIAPPNFEWNWDDILQAAVASKYPNMIDDVISLNRLYFKANPPDWQKLAEIALTNTDLEMFESIKDKVPENYKWDYQNLLESATQGDDETFAYIWEFLPEEEKRSGIAWNPIVELAIESPQPYILDHVLKHIATYIDPEDHQLDYEKLIDLAADENMDVRKLFVILFSVHPNDLETHVINWSIVTEKAIETNNPEIIFDVIGLVYDPSELEWEFIWEYFIKKNNFELIVQLLNISNVNGVDTADIMTYADRFGTPEMKEFIERTLQNN